MNIDLVEALIRSEALRIAPSDQVFWYTSGTIGPYYINTHYLLGGPATAEDFLSFIDADTDTEGFAAQVGARLESVYQVDEGYRAVVDALVDRARQVVREKRGNCISGGERRDWFFSPIVACELGLPHLYIYKDLSAVLQHPDGSTEPAPDLGEVRALHVADLVTEASSYSRAWVPVVRQGGGEMIYALNVIDRAQGGSEALAALNVEAGCLLRVDEELFVTLLERGLIDARQRDGLTAYFRDPEGAMRSFLTAHPLFLQESLAAEDSRVAQRARLLVERDPYDLGLSLKD